MKQIAVIGSGTMGNGIAHTFAQAGFTVKLIDISEKSLEKGMATIAANLDRMVTKGLPQYAPFDSIIVTAGAPIIPQALLSQLKIGGRLVIPIGDKEQIMTLLIRKNETQFEKTELGDFKFVPLLENKN